MIRWRHVERVGSLGHPFECWEPVMPRIPDFLLDTVIYLYPTTMDAESGVSVGGTGFLVSVPAVTAGVPAALYAVTNSHIIREANSPVARLNTQEGRKEVIPLTVDQWHHHPDGDDIAVCPIGLQSEHHRFFALSRTDWFLTKEELDADGIGPGDEVFFIGRYINHEGQQKNLPTVRFGTISMLPYEPVLHPRGTLVDSFLIEARSLSGYSGSPVFLFVMPYTFRDMEWSGPDEGLRRAGRETRQAMLGLLGIDWGHDADFKPVLESDKKTPLTERWWVEQNSGIMNVAPTWKLSELLDEPELANMRRKREQDWIKEHGTSSAVLDEAVESVQSSATEPSSLTKTADLMGRLLQVPKEQADEVHRGRQ